MKRGKPTDTPGISTIPGGFSLRVRVRRGSVTIERAREMPGATRAQAEAAREQLREDATKEAEERAAGVDPTTVASLGMRWLEELAGRREAKRMTHATVDGHRANMERFVLPFFGRMKPAEVAPFCFYEFFAWLEVQKTSTERRGRPNAKGEFKTYEQEARPYSWDTLHGGWRTARRFFGWLTVRERLPANPAMGVRFEVTAPKGQPKATLNDAEQGRLVEALTSDLRLLAMVCVDLVGGLRFSELSGLHVEDFGDAHYEIRRSVVKGKVGPPKTRSSRRVVALGDARGIVKAYLATLPRDQTIAFAGSTGNYPTLRVYNDALKDAAARAGITKNVSSHVIRKTANNLLRRATTPQMAKAVLGHVTEESHERYSDYELAEREQASAAAFSLPHGPWLGGTGPTPEA